MQLKSGLVNSIKFPNGDFWTFLIVFNFMIATYLKVSNLVLFPLIILSLWFFIIEGYKNKNIVFLGFVTLFSYISFLLFKFNYNQVAHLDDIIPISILTFFLFNLATSSIKKSKIIKFFCVFFIVEIIVGIVLFISGNQNIYLLISNLSDINNYDWNLQLTGVNGLSDSPTFLGVNSFMFLILMVDYFNNLKWFELYIILGCLGVLLSGSKFMIFLLIPFLIYNFYLLKKTSILQSVAIVLGSLTLFLIILISLTSLQYVNELMSERIKLLFIYSRFISDHLIFGNYSTQYRYLNNAGKPFHAHNSIIQAIANHGLIYFTLILGLVATQIRNTNVSSLFFLTLLCLCNHILFWGFYHVDFIFVIILFHNPKICLSSQNNLQIQ